MWSLFKKKQKNNNIKIITKEHFEKIYDELLKEKIEEERKKNELFNASFLWSEYVQEKLKGIVPLEDIKVVETRNTYYLSIDYEDENHAFPIFATIDDRDYVNLYSPSYIIRKVVETIFEIREKHMKKSE